MLGYIMEQLMVRRVYSRDPVYSLLLTFGLSFIIQDVCRYIWGPNGLPLTVPDSLSQGLSSDLFFITGYRVFMMTIVIVSVVGLFAFLRYTRMGMRIRAGTLDLDTVAALGINVRLLRTFNFARGHLSRRPGRRAGGWPDRPQSEHGRRSAAAASSPSSWAASAA